MSLTDPASELIARQLYQGLVDVGNKGVVPAVAKKWSASDNEKTWVFKLKHFRFSDGNQVRASDFVFAFDRIASKEGGSDLAYLLNEIKGFTAVNQGRASHMTGLVVKGPRELQITLTHPDANLPALMTHPALVPLEPDAVARSSFLRRPIGNGPFELAMTWDPGQPVVLKANKRYPDPPAIDGIRFRVYSSSIASYKDLVNGKVDVSEVPPLAIDDAATRFGTRGFRPFLSSTYYVFNLKHHPLQRPRLRKAVSAAINRDRIAKVIYQGTLALPRGVVPEGMPGFDRNACTSACDYRPRLARRVVRRLSPKARSITVTTNKGDPYERVNKVIARDLRDVGFSVHERSYSFRRYLRLIAARREQLYRISWLAEYPDPDVFLRDLFTTHGTGNDSSYSDKRVDALVRRAMATSSKNTRQHLYRRAEHRIMHDLPVVPLGSFQTHWAARSSVHGIEFDDNGGFDASRVTIEGR